MRIELIVDANLSNCDIAAIARIVDGIVDGWHSWLGPDPGDPQIAAYFEQNPTHQEVLEKSFVSELAYGDAAGKTLRVHTASTPVTSEDDSFSLDDAVSYLRQPLQILLENSRNDGKFLELTLSLIDAPIIIQLKAPRPAAVYSHAGGKAEMLKLIEDAFEVADRLGRVPPRIFAIVDSDAKYPGHITSETRRLTKLCLKFGVGVHVWTKRMIENYVSLEGLREYVRISPEKEGDFRFFQQLTSDQLDHYPFKSGIQAENGVPSSLVDQEVRLYEGLDWTEVIKPTFPRVAEYLVDGQIPLTMAHLIERNALEELQQLANIIRREI
jgi:hypothetical protein